MRKIFFLSLVLSLHAYAGPLEDAETLWGEYKKTHQQSSDILDFFGTLKNPAVILATASTGLSAGLDPHPSIERLNRFQQMLMKAYRDNPYDEDEVKKLVESRASHIWKEKTHQFDEVISFWKKNEPSVNSEKFSEIEKKANISKVMNFYDDDASLRVNEDGSFPNDPNEDIFLSLFPTLAFYNYFDARDFNKLIFLNPTFETIECRISKEDKALAQSIIDNFFKNVHEVNVLISVNNAIKEIVFSKRKVNLKSLKLYGNFHIKDIFDEGSVIEELMIEDNEILDEQDLQFIKTKIKGIKKVVFGVKTKITPETFDKTFHGTKDFNAVYPKQKK